jgi:hypothetical protein
MADRDQHERDQEEIERIKRPTKKTGDKRVPLLAIQDFEKPNRFHFFVSYLSFRAESRNLLLFLKYLEMSPLRST